MSKEIKEYMGLVSLQIENINKGDRSYKQEPSRNYEVEKYKCHKKFATGFNSRFELAE